MTITIDSREASKHPEFQRKLQKFTTVEVKTLEYGDFFVRGLKKNVLVERTSVPDLLRKRGIVLFNQIIGMKGAQNAEPRLLIEGSLDEARHYSKWSLNSVAGILVAVEEDFHVPIFTIPSISWVPRYFERLLKNIGTPKEKKFYPLRLKPKIRTMDEAARCVLEGTKHIGPSMAHLLLKELGSLITVVEAPEDVLYRIIGKRIGAKRTHTVWEVFHHKYGLSKA